ncbi:hypothetical protein BC834DRAFT_595719 [Gloeopeniophorella convolvens]|nr:hypothetical protein BC834DRAFT_595719 [Gloeopeniophorella convolvens]
MTTSRPGWQTDELQDEWPEDNTDETDHQTRTVSLTIPVGSLRYVPEHSSPEPPVRETVSADATGTFLIRQDALSLHSRTPGQRLGIIKDFFSPIPLERMFEAPPPKDPPTRAAVEPSLPSSPPPLTRPSPPFHNSPIRSVGSSSQASRHLSHPTEREGLGQNMQCQFTFAVSRPAALPNSLHPKLSGLEDRRVSAKSTLSQNADPPLRLFQFQYDTFTRDHLSAMVDSIAVNSPSGSNAGSFPENVSSPFGLSTVSETSVPSSSVDFRSAKRVKLSSISDLRGTEHSVELPARRPSHRSHCAVGTRSPTAPVKQARDFTAQSILGAPLASTDNEGNGYAFEGGDARSRDGLSRRTHSLEDDGNVVAKGLPDSLRRKEYSSMGYRQQAASLMAQIKQDMRGAKRIFSADITDSSFEANSRLETVARPVRSDADLSCSPCDIHVTPALRLSVRGRPSPAAPLQQRLIRHGPYRCPVSRTPDSRCPAPISTFRLTPTSLHATIFRSPSATSRYKSQFTLDGNGDTDTHLPVIP